MLGYVGAALQRASLPQITFLPDKYSSSTIWMRVVSNQRRLGSSDAQSCRIQTLNRPVAACKEALNP